MCCGAIANVVLQLLNISFKFAFYRIMKRHPVYNGKAVFYCYQRPGSMNFCLIGCLCLMQNAATKIFIECFGAGFIRKVAFELVGSSQEVDEKTF